MPADRRAADAKRESLVSASDRRYLIDDGIPLLYTDENDDVAIGVTHRVRESYEEVPFPSYNDFDTIDRFVKKAEEGVFARLLRKQLPANSRVVEIGCGTGQLSNYMAATTGSRVYATDHAVGEVWRLCDSWVVQPHW